MCVTEGAKGLQNVLKVISGRFIGVTANSRGVAEVFLRVSEGLLCFTGGPRQFQEFWEPFQGVPEDFQRIQKCNGKISEVLRGITGSLRRTTVFEYSFRITAFR